MLGFDLLKQIHYRLVALYLYESYFSMNAETILMKEPLQNTSFIETFDFLGRNKKTLISYIGLQYNDIHTTMWMYRVPGRWNITKYYIYLLFDNDDNCIKVRKTRRRYNNFKKCFGI